MELKLTAFDQRAVDQYSTVPIRFEVKSVLQVEVIGEGLGGIRLTEAPVHPSYWKDYDQLKGEGPRHWLKRWDTSSWVCVTASEHGQPVGGALIACNTPGLFMLEDWRDLAVLWDIRVSPEHRGRGIGTAIFHQAADWSRSHGYRQMKIETQNTNVPACRFYRKMGCTLGTVNRFAYAGSPSVAGEVQLLWYLDLSDRNLPIPVGLTRV